MKKRLVAALLTTAMVSALLTGCGSSQTETATEEAATEEAAEEEVAEEAAEEEAEADATEEKAEDAEEGTGFVMDMDNMLGPGSPYEGLTANGDYSFQVVVKAFQNTYWQAVVLGVNDAASDLGVKADCQGPNTESDIADQVNMINAAINGGGDGIGLAACDASSVVDSLNKAKEMGVPIVAFDTSIGTAPEGTVQATIATDALAAGDVAAEHVFDTLSYKMKEGGVRVGVVAQDATSTNHQERGIGFINGLIERCDAEGITVAVTGNDWFVNNAVSTADEASADVIIDVAIPAQSTVDLSNVEASAILNKEDTICLYTTGGTAAEGMIAANNNLDVLGSDPEEDIIGIGFDAGVVLKEAVANGTVYGAITQMPYGMGYYTVCALTKLANGESIDDLEIPGYWYDSTNMDDPLIAPNLYD